MPSKIIQEYMQKTRDFLNNKISAQEYDTFFWESWKYFVKEPSGTKETSFISTAATSADSYCPPEIMGEEEYDGIYDLNDEQLKQEILEKYNKHFPNEPISEVSTEQKPKLR